MKIYIAGKITGLDNYKEMFANFERKLISDGHSVMNPAVLNSGFEHHEYMKVCYAMIDVCDHVCFMNNWHDSTGAKMEMEYAMDNLKTISIED